MLKSIGKAISKCALVPAFCIVLSAALSGCGLVREESDCVASYNIVNFVYDYNMKFADAFDHEVERVTLYAFDHESGVLVKRIQTWASDLDADHSMVLEVEPGNYDLLVWAGDYDDSFDIAEGAEEQTALSELHAYMHRTVRDGDAHVFDRVQPLFHGLISVVLPYASPSRPNYVSVPLVKDTNAVRVVLQQISGDPVDASDFNFTITDANGWLNSDNTLRDNVSITYHPFFIKTGEVDINNNPEDLNATLRNAQPGAPATRSALTAALAEFSVGRLTTQTDPVLHITRRDGSTVLRINIRDYALLVKGETNSAMPVQEYLDRQDEYNMTFFLDRDARWLSSVVIINDWRIIFNETPAE